MTLRGLLCRRPYCQGLYAPGRCGACHARAPGSGTCPVAQALVVSASAASVLSGVDRSGVAQYVSSKTGMGLDQLRKFALEELYPPVDLTADMALAFLLPCSFHFQDVVWV